MTIHASTVPSSSTSPTDPFPSRRRLTAWSPGSKTEHPEVLWEVPVRIGRCPGTVEHSGERPVKKP